MKYVYTLLFALLLTGCTKVGYIEFTGTMPGISNGMFVIKDINGAPVYAEDIFNGKFHLRKILQVPGYYRMQVVGDITKDNKRVEYDVYLEPGTYTISAEGDKLYKYPAIASTSKIQNELTGYYSIADVKEHKAEVKVDSLYKVVYGQNEAVLSETKPAALLNKLNAAISDRDNIQIAALQDFVNKYPQNEVAAHIMEQIDYKKDPEASYRIYQKFTSAEKNSNDGQDIGSQLKDLVKLAPGSQAPELVGKTPNGKPFNAKTINKKMILVEFWRSDNEVSRANHNKLLNDYYSPLKIKSFTVVSFCLDTTKGAWTDAIAKDKMTWTQVSDLKGENSPNMATWAITEIPTYDLLDGNWHIVKRDISFNDIPTTVSDYLKVPLN